jgi:hypothetical protein
MVAKFIYIHAVITTAEGIVFNSIKAKFKELLYTCNMRMKKIVCITMDAELLANLDYCRHSVPRSTYLSLLVKEHLKVIEEIS